MQGKDDHLTVINESYGQGGGRILRTFLALSAIHQKPVAIQHIRANRNNPGLWPQPLKELETLAHSMGAKIKGVSMDSPRVHYAFQKRGERRSEGSMETSSV
jgi:RNA 3'-terminal phosphate cyclase (ATP)